MKLTLTLTARFDYDPDPDWDGTVDDILLELLDDRGRLGDVLEDCRWMPGQSLTADLVADE